MCCFDKDQRPLVSNIFEDKDYLKLCNRDKEQMNEI